MHNLRLILRALTVRPVQVVHQSALIILGRTTPSSVEGAPATVLVLALGWFGVSVWSDAVKMPQEYSLLGATVELAAWPLGLWYLLRSQLDRFWQSWMAIAGVSIILWTTSIAAHSVGMSQALQFMLVVALATRGYGKVIEAARTPAVRSPYQLAIVWFFSLAVVIGLSKPLFS